jgi:hypothetical protein
VQFCLCFKRCETWWFTIWIFTKQSVRNACDKKAEVTRWVRPEREQKLQVVCVCVCVMYVCMQVKVNVSPHHALQAQKGSNGIGPLIRNFGARSGWVVNATSRLLLLAGRVPVPIVREAGWHEGRIWTVVEMRKPFAVTGFEPRTVQRVASRNAYCDIAAPVFVYCIEIGWIGRGWAAGALKRTVVKTCWSGVTRVTKTLKEGCTYRLSGTFPVCYIQTSSLFALLMSPPPPF